MDKIGLHLKIDYTKIKEINHETIHVDLNCLINSEINTVGLYQKINGLPEIQSIEVEYLV